ncbi:PAS domain S-box protein [Planomonospora sp. ID67723]|uniref:sensor histidine kinase n=1 Tax=Planomonospora sp. ID67723 TaxID=2738134 RepID=UPI0018C3F667|nr:ATP-binding protein [Planomonospora sp. ID67723]MBG0831805.1 PAS domain S-box protein [Planomonospora sp. ID67723]
MPNEEREESLVALLEDVTAIVDTTEDPRSAAQAMLHAVRKMTGWPLGHLWVPDGPGGAFVSSGVWAGPIERFPHLHEVTARAQLPVGTGAAGQAAATGRPLWSRDLTGDPLFAHVHHDGAVEARAALTVPVVTGDVVVAVLEFFCPQALAPDEPMLRILASLSRQMGRMAERWRARQETQTVKRQLEQVIETSVEAFVSTDADERIIGWNAAAERMFGLSRQQALGKIMHRTIVPARYQALYQQERERFLATGQSSTLGRRLQVAAVRADGSEFPVETVIWATREAGAWTFNAFLHDITDRRRAEQALQQAYTQEQATVARLEELDHAKSAFIDTIGHELSTPLAGILGYLEILTTTDDDALPADRRMRMMRAVIDNAMRLQKLIEDVLAVNATTGRPRKTVPVPTTVQAVITEAVRTAKAETRSGEHPVRAHVDAGLPALHADHGLLVRAVNALLSNAVKFSVTGTPITVHASLAGDAVAIAVSDSGMGIGADDLPYVFDRFYRTAAVRQAAIQGIGLGLAIAKDIVEAHGGTLTASSLPGEGSTFTLLLPYPRSDP